MLRARLTLAWHLDRTERRLRRAGEKLGWPQPWLQEFAEVTGDPRITIEEFWVRYATRRERAHEQMLAVKTEEDALGFYATSDYLLYRQIIHRRHAAWRTVLAGMSRPQGTLLEFGCGIGPVSAWCARRRPAWSFALWDVPGPHRDYARARLLRLHDSCLVADDAADVDVITALDVFEHCADPLAAARRLVATLQPGGLLYWNFVELHGARGDLDLATPTQRAETLAYLREALACVWQRPGLIVSEARDHAVRARERGPA